jgi:DNA-binding MarR family transcriptional regulator
MMSDHPLDPQRVRQIGLQLVALADSLDFGRDRHEAGGRAKKESVIFEEYAPRLANVARAEYKARELRGKFIDSDLIGEPVWDMLLDLFIKTVDGKQVSVTSLCIASRVAPTTALRYIKELVDRKLILRKLSSHDARMTYLELTDSGFVSIGKALQARANIFSTMPEASAEEILLMRIASQGEGRDKVAVNG